jgi:hypothetical protein
MKTKFNAQKILLILFLLFIGVNASKAVGIDVSSSGKINGRIFCTDSKSPIESVSVTLFSATDSSMVAGTISNSNGSFSFSMLDSGEYFLEIEDANFKKVKIGKLNIQNNTFKIQLDDIELTTQGKIAKRKRNK